MRRLILTVLTALEAFLDCVAFQADVAVAGLKQSAVVHHLRVADAFLFLRLVSSDRKLLIATGGFDCLLRTRAVIIWARCSWPVDAVFCQVKIYLSHAACPALPRCFCVVVCASAAVLV